MSVSGEAESAVSVPAQSAESGSGSEAYPTLDTEALTREITDEAEAELVGLNIGDSSVALMVSGYWAGTLNANAGFAFTPLGTQAYSGDSPFLFTQEADLTLSLWIRERWFIEAGFVDDYTMNTYRAGYQGFPGEPVQYAGVGNTGLDFPVFPYLDLGGDSPSSFGFYGRFGGGDFSLHTLARYDAAAREERIFVGNRERSYSFVDLSRPLRGLSFVLPDDGLDSAPVVYIQDKNGGLTDSGGRRWREASPGEYSSGAAYGLVELKLGAYTGSAEEPDGMIAVSYSKNGNAPWRSSLGDYEAAVPSVPETGGNFLGEVQAYFDESGRSLSLKNYPQPGGGASPAGGISGRPGETLINGIPALIIYEPGTFSPFEKQNRYRYSSSGAEAALVRLSSGERIQGYEVLPLEDSASYLVLPSEGTETRGGVYELIRETDTSSPRAARERWPLASGAENLPELYLPGKQVFSGDLGLRFAAYGNSADTAGMYYIGDDIVPGSVQVMRGGTTDPNFSFNESSGTVSLANPPMFNEIIRISYLKRSEETRLGSFAAGVGALYDPPGAFSSKIGLGLRWNNSQDAYSSGAVSSPGTIGLGAGAGWDYDRLKTGLTFGLGFEQSDTTGLYRAAGMEGNEIILSLPPGESFLSGLPGATPLAVSAGLSDLAGRAPLVYRNYRETSILGTSSLLDIVSSAPVLSDRNGPYPAMDKSMGVQILAGEFELSADRFWTGFETSLGLDGTLLEGAKEIEVPFRLYGFSGNAEKVKIVFQAGSLADMDSGDPENPGLIMESVLYEYDPSDALGDGPRIKSVNLDDDDRRKLANAKYLRILVYADGLEPSETISGRVLLAPPIVKGADYRAVFYDKNGQGGIYPASDFMGAASAAVLERMDTAVPPLREKYRGLIDRLHPEGERQRVLEIKWENPAPGTAVGTDTRLGPVPFDSYRTLSFFVRIPQAEDQAEQDRINESSFVFFVGRGPESVSRKPEKDLEAEIPVSAFINAGLEPGQWAKAEIRYRGEGSGVYVEGKKVQGAAVSYNSGANSLGGGAAFGGDSGENRSSYMAFLLMPPETQALPDGTMALDEVILEDAAPSYRMNAGGSAEWRLPGPLLSIRETAVFSDLLLQAAVESAGRLSPEDGPEHGYLGMNGRGRGEISIFGFRVTGDYSYAVNADDGDNFYDWKAGHSLSRSFGPFSMTESFNDAPPQNAMDHLFSMSLSSVLRSSLSAEIDYADRRMIRKWNAGAGVKPRDFPLDIFIQTNADWTENTDEPEKKLGSYGLAWLESWEPMLPDWGNGALRRDARAAFSANLGTEPVGFIVNLEASSLYSDPAKSLQSVSLGRIDVPWIFEFGGRRFGFVFREEREYRRSLIHEAFDFREDAGRYGESFEGSVPLLFSVPFYSFGNYGLREAMRESNSLLPEGAIVSSSRFTDKFEILLNMPENYGFSALFVPQAMSLSASRVLEQKMDTLQDTFNLGGGFRFSAINVFGAMGSASLFDFYSNDEFSHFVETLLSFPREGKNMWTVRAGQALSFYGFGGAELKIDNTLTLRSSSSVLRGSRWSENFTLAWTSPVEKSLLGTAYEALMRMARGQSSWLTLAELAEAEYEKLRIETLEFIFNHEPAEARDDDYTAFSVIAGHESVVRIFGRLNLSVFAKINFSEDSRTGIISFLGSVGTSLRLIF